MGRTTTVGLVASILMMGCSTEEGIIVDERGGLLISDDGLFSLEVPAGALEQPVDITLEEVGCKQPGLIGICYEMEPLGLPFSRPGRVTYQLDPADLTGIEPSAVTVLTEGEERWAPLPDLHVDVEQEVVTASVVYLSSYAVVGPGA